jgi:hypothetical protein
VRRTSLPSAYKLKPTFMTKKERKYKRQNNQTICADFDETLCRHQEYGEFGLLHEKPMAGAKEAMEQLKKEGYRIVVLTVRLNPSFGGDLRWKKWVIQHWLQKFEIPFDEITNNKPKAVAYIDNKGIRFTDWQQTLRQFHLFHPALFARVSPQGTPAV